MRLISQNSAKTVFFILLFTLNLAYAAEKPVLRYRSSSQAYFDYNMKTCINKETVFYARARHEDIFEGLICKWEFGDGSAAEGREVTKVYAEPGIYIVKLILYDPLGKVISRAQNRVFVYSQPIAEAGDDIIVCFGNSVLLDGSKSKVTNFFERCFNCELLSYVWDFGDGTPEARGVKVKHKYKRPGTYKVTLTVHDGKNRKCSTDKDTLVVVVNNKPSIVLKEVEKDCVGKSIDFEAFINATKRENIERSSLRYVWDFGDGTVEEGGARMPHIYQKGGEYLVTVSADDGYGTICSTDTQTLKVKLNTPPVANAGPNLVCCINTESVFDASSSYDPDGDSLSYFWDFGDGTTAKGPQVTHVYKERGKYKVTLTVDDNSGTPCSQVTSSFEAIASDKPVSLIDIY